ncbi:MAG: type II secretion system protein GspL [Gallionella sp.]|nr:type II secretion system protein GspL [Gallionella sp.]
MSTLYIRLPSKSAADSAAHWLELVCPFALVSHGDSIEREGAASLPGLSDMIAKAQRVVLLLAASDVTLLRVQVPPLSAARLKAALPNLVEDQLIADPSGCVMVAGGLSDGLRTIAVVQRAWLELLAKTLNTFGARRLAALPAQLCLPYQPGQQDQPGGVTAAINEQGADIDVLLRLSEQDGIGLAIAPALSQAEGRDQCEASAQEVIRTLCAVTSEAPITLYVPQLAVHTYQKAIDRAAAPTKRINVFADNWPRWIAGAQGTALDLMAGLGTESGSRLDWRAWRWPLALAAAVLIINATALNIDWWRMKGEANLLRTAMIQIYKSAYPNESVIIDPVAQMRQKIAIAKRDSGLPAADDFTAISAAFGEAWASVMPGKAAPAIATLEYRERSLFVQFKPNTETPAQQMKAALAERSLSLSLEPLDPVSAQSAAVVWKIRSTK